MTVKLPVYLPLVSFGLLAFVLVLATGGLHGSGVTPAIGGGGAAPVLTSAFNDAGSGGDPPGTHVLGTLKGLPNTMYSINLYYGTSCGNAKTSGTYAGKLTNQLTDDMGDLDFATGSTEIPAGKVMTATATNQDTNDTSGFSNCVTIQPATLTPSPTLSPSPTPRITVTHAASPTPTGTQGAELIQGDVTCDGLVDEADFSFMIQYFAGLNDGTQPDPCPDLGEALPAAVSFLWGDVDCLNGLNALDALYVLAHKAGIELEQPPECVAIGSPLV